MVGILINVMLVYPENTGILGSRKEIQVGAFGAGFV